MTEEEAKTKWCPHARSYLWAGTMERGIPATVNRYSVDMLKVPEDPIAHQDCTCLGSGCMAWRWIDRTQSTDDEYEFKTVRVGGYCGLAGSP